MNNEENQVPYAARLDIFMWLLVILPLVTFPLPDSMNVVVGMVGLMLCVWDSRSLAYRGYNAPHVLLGLISPIYVLVRAIKLNDVWSWVIFAAYIASIALSMALLFIQYSAMQ